MGDKLSGVLIILLVCGICYWMVEDYVNEVNSVYTFCKNNPNDLQFYSQSILLNCTNGILNNAYELSGEYMNLPPKWLTLVMGIFMVMSGGYVALSFISDKSTRNFQGCTVCKEGINEKCKGCVLYSKLDELKNGE
jgi:hypothetical protein